MKAAKGVTRKHSGGTKHAGSKKHHPSAAQQAARKKWQHAGAHAHHAHHHSVAHHAKHAKAVKWTPAADVSCCAIEALAASLRLAGALVAEADVLDLYWRITQDPDAGMPLEAAILGAAEFGLAGIRLLGARPAARLGDGVVFGVDLAERHALTVDGHGVWSWGEWHPASCELFAGADEAWELDWAVV